MTSDEATQLILWAVNERLDMDIEDFGVGVRAKILSIINQIADTAGNDRMIEVAEKWELEAKLPSHERRLPWERRELVQSVKELRKIAEAAPTKPPHDLTHAP